MLCWPYTCIQTPSAFKQNVCIHLLIPHLDGDLGVLVRQLESVVEHLQVLLQGEGGGGQLLLVRLDVLGQPGGRVDEQQLLAALEAREQPLVVLGVLAHPRVAVVHKHGRHVLIGKIREDHKPLGEEISLEAIAWANVGEVHHNLIRLGVIGLKGKEHMVDEEVAVDLACFEPRVRRDTNQGHKGQLVE